MYGDFQTKLENQSASFSAPMNESSWLLYLRLLGTATLSCLAAATVLHQIHCELSQETTHWLAAGILVAVAALGIVILGSRLVESPVHSRIGTGINTLTLGLNLAFVDLCDIHHMYFVVMLVINAAAFLLFLQTREFPSDAPRDDNRNPLGPLDRPPPAADGETELRSTMPDRAETVARSYGRKTVWLLLAAGFITYMMIVPTIGMVIDWLTPPKSGKLLEMTTMEWVRVHTVSGVVMLIFMAMGASVGSFLNVLIFRMPRFKPLLWPPSTCTNCKTKLSLKDNIPIVGWLQLNGSCRYCGMKLSARYPIIESIVAAVVVMFFYRELLTGGLNLAERQPNSYRGISFILFYPKWDLITIYVFHMSVLSLLLGWGMINYDRFKVPWSRALICCAVVLGLTIAFPHLNPSRVIWSEVLPTIPPSVSAALAGCIGGLILGFIMDRLLPLAPITTNANRSNAAESTETEAIETSTDQTQAPVLHASTEPHAEVAETTEAASNNTEQTLQDEAPEDPAEEPKVAYGAFSENQTTTGSVSASLALVGAAMGFKAVLMIFVLTIVLYLPYKLVSQFLASENRSTERWPPALFVFGASVLLLTFWVQAHMFVGRLIPGPF